ncbi:hypothetical protein LTR53_007679 [Teratosphaeriaceae sp. CCFEE 6253]|nr:hypothetical protein LTR53_007679 [Teratosphaeriaceae sp. CCFEE 6253]
MLSRSLNPSSLGSTVFWISMGAVTLIALAALSNIAAPAFAFGGLQQHHSPAQTGDCGQTLLAGFALRKVLTDAAPVFGDYEAILSDTSTWMKAYPDDTLLVHMNIPGTHDADTWNYSLATQQSLNHVTSLASIAEFDPAFYRCQDRSMLRMLNDGIRAFDLRYAFDVTNTTLVFWHGPGLVSETATVDDVLYGFYQWLDDHPSETLLLSFQYEGSTTPYASNDAGVQLQLFDALTSPAARHYFLQTAGSIGTLGQARGKITLLKRFDQDMLPAYYTDALPGVHFSPADWTDNSPNITLVYNISTGATAYIEDYYQPLTPANSTAEENIQWKASWHLHPTS